MALKKMFQQVSGAAGRRLFSSFKPLDPNFERRIRDSFDKQTFMHHIGAVISHIEPGEIDLTSLDQPTLKQQHNFFHMGVTTTLADTAAGYAAYSLFPENTDVLTTGDDHYQYHVCLYDKSAVVVL